MVIAFTSFATLSQMATHVRHLAFVCSMPWYFHQHPPSIRLALQSQSLECALGVRLKWETMMTHLTFPGRLARPWTGNRRWRAGTLTRGSHASDHLQ